MPSSSIGPQETPGASQVGELAADVPAGTPAAGTPAAGTPAAGTPAAGTSATGAPVARGNSPAGQRTVFSRVLGSRSGRHQADPGPGERTSGPAGDASFPSAAPGHAPDPAQAQASYVGAPVAHAQATTADPGRPPARHAQRPARPAANGPGYSRTPMSPLQPGDSGFRANGFQDQDSQDTRSQDQDFQDTRSQEHDLQDARYQTSDSYASAPPDIRFPSDVATPAAAPADRPDSPAQDDAASESSQWDTSPGPMGSRRPGRG
jgi:hypothetical protein